MPSDAQKRATERYQKEKVKQQIVKFYPTDMDLWEHLQKQSNKMGYVFWSSDILTGSQARAGDA